MKTALPVFFLTLIFLSNSHACAQEPEKRIYIANDDHTDFMWTADAETYASVFVEMLDFHLKLADDTAGNAMPYRNRFNCDGSHWLWCYEQRKSPAKFAKLIARIKDGTISAPLNAVVSCYGGQPAEAVLRGMYYSGRLERKYDLRFPLAVAMENQTLPLGLTSLFSGSGAKYSWRGVCGCASKMNQKPFEKRSREILWWTGHDGQRLLLKWHSLVPPGNRQSGGYSEAFDPIAAIEFLDADSAFLARYRGTGMAEPYRVRAAFGFGWDALDRKTGQPYHADPKTYPVVNHFHSIAKELSNDQRQVIVSNEVDFFADFEKTHGSSLDSQTVTYGNEWDLYSASMSETSARVKRAVEKLRSAEMLAALVSLKQPDFMQKHTQARDLAFSNLGLYWEHNWTADGPITRAQRGAWQDQLASQIDSYVNALQNDAIDRLGRLILKPAESKRFFVLNPLGWNRTEPADFAYTGSVDIHVRDLVTGKDVPHQFIDRRGAKLLRILATDVPSAGYKVFEILPGQATKPADDAAIVSGEGDSTFENESVKLIIERDGSIRSLIDKVNGNVELAANIGGLWLNDFAANSAEGSPLQVENRGPVSATVVARSQAGLDHSTAITLYRGSNRIDVQNELNANFNDTRYWTFSFALNQPTVHTEEIGSINLNKLQSAGGDYADTHARYDHITVNHFADVTSGTGKLGVTISNPDLAFGILGNSTFDKLDSVTPQVRMLAGGQVDGPSLGIPSQYGNSNFLQRFALRPHDGYDSTSAMKFALEHQNPLVTGSVVGDSLNSSPADSYSLLNVSNPNVLLWALKVHDDGAERGLTARLWNVSNEAAQSEISFTPRLKAAHRTTHIETDLEPIPLSNSNSWPTMFAREQLQTFRVELAPCSTSADAHQLDDKPLSDVPGVTQVAIGVTRDGTEIPAFITQADLDVFANKTRVLIVGGLDGSPHTTKAAINVMQRFYTKAEFEPLRQFFALSVIPCGNPDGLAKGLRNDNGSGGDPSRGYPPSGDSYVSETNPESQYLWRWIGMHAPDIVIEFIEGKDHGQVDFLATHPFADALSNQLSKSPACGVGTIDSLTVSIPIGIVTPFDEFANELLTELKKTPVAEGDDRVSFSAARLELQSRDKRSSREVCDQLALVYGHEMPTVAYIPSVACIGRLRLAVLAKDRDAVADVERITAEYSSGAKPTLNDKSGGSEFAGHILWGELFDATENRKCIELTLNAADRAFATDGQPLEVMPTHNEMSDAVFMGCPILAQAGRLTGNRKYFDMCLKHMRFMLELNLRSDGLHRHSPLSETAWGRGNGFPALGLALALEDIPTHYAARAEMLAEFQKHLAALLPHQDLFGAWHQVIDHPESYRELSATCMITYAMTRGVRRGWLPKKDFEPAIAKAWKAIKARVGSDGSLVDVCTGTGKQKSLRDYLDRQAILGRDPRGGAMALLAATEILAWESEM